MRWGEHETRYLVRHRDDGAELIAEALGRSTDSVRSKAKRLGVELTYRKLEICPVCGTSYVRPNTKAGTHGMCVSCWDRRKADTMRERVAEIRAAREYDAAKKKYRRARHGS